MLSLGLLISIIIYSILMRRIWILINLEILVLSLISDVLLDSSTLGSIEGVLLSVLIISVSAIESSILLCIINIL